MNQYFENSSLKNKTKGERLHLTVDKLKTLAKLFKKL